MSVVHPNSSFVPVTFAPYALDPDLGRRRLTVGHGHTIEQIVATGFPDLPAALRERLIVRLVTANGIAVVEPQYWRLVRPKAGTQVVVMMAPGKGALQLLVSIAAVAAAAVFAPWLAGALGIKLATAQGLIAAGVNMVGGLLLNALLAQKEKKDRPQYAITGWKNEARPEEAVPLVLGRIRLAPAIAASTYMEVVGDQMWTRQIFCHGIGPLALSEHKEGDDLIVPDKNLQIEHRAGYADDTALTLYTNQVVEEPVGTEMLRLYKRDDAGKQLGTLDDPEPVKKTTGRRCKRAVIILRWGSGLGYVTQSGSKRAMAVEFKLRYRAAGSPAWVDLPNVTISRRKFAERWDAIPIDFPALNAYEIELTRLTRSELPENAEASLISDCQWVALQTHRQEYPINAGVPLALTAIRAKGTHKRNGVLDSYNCVAERVTTGFGVGWPVNKASNPATSALAVLRQSGVLVTPRATDTIDWTFFDGWRAFCDLKSLKFDMVSYGANLEELLKIVGAAGRASIFFDGALWTGIIDRPRAAPVDLITPHNSETMTFETAYFKMPDAFRVKFLDATNDFEETERVVRRPGFIGAIVTTETIEMPGKTDPDEIYREATRRFYELQYRNTIYRTRMDDILRSGSRGDLVHASVDMLRRAIASGEVVAVRDRQVEITEFIEYKPGVQYAARWRKPPAGDGSDQGHVVAPIRTWGAETKTFIVDGDGGLPVAGDIVVIGEMGSDSIPLIITGIRRSKDGVSELSFLPAAEVIDTLTDAAVIPPWDPKVGEIIELSGVAPLKPVITSVTYDTTTGLTTVAVAANSGDVLPIANFELGHRLAGAGSYTVPAPAPAGTPQFTLAGYVIGANTQMRVRATSAYGATGLWSDAINITITATPPPLALPEEAIQIIGKNGQAEITFATGADPNVIEVAIYRDGVVLPARIPVSPSGTFGRIDGDSTRANLASNAGFGSDIVWVKGPGWTIASGTGTKAAGTASDIRQPIGMAAGRTYRGCVTVSGRTAGTLTPRLTGGATVNAPAISANGRVLFGIVAGTSPANIGFQANAAFDGSIDDVIVYEETAGCLAQGSHTYQLEPYNSEGVAGPMSAVRTVTVV